MVYLGFEPGGGRMEGADESTELWQHPYGLHNLCLKMYR